MRDWGPEILLLPIIFYLNQKKKDLYLKCLRNLTPLKIRFNIVCNYYVEKEQIISEYMVHRTAFKKIIEKDFGVILDHK